jgi:hypothetical protein
MFGGKRPINPDEKQKFVKSQSGEWIPEKVTVNNSLCAIGVNDQTPCDDSRSR